MSSTFSLYNRTKLFCVSNNIFKAVEKELIGVLYNRPVYKIIRVDNAKLPYKLNTRTLLIGDGKEFPILIIKDVLKAMFHYILEDNSFVFSNDFYGDCGLKDNEILEKIVFEHDSREHFIFDNFTDKDFDNFAFLCKSDTLKNPYHHKINLDFWDWFHISIGEFIWHTNSDLTDLIPFSSYDYFSENYLKTKKVQLKYNNINATPKVITGFKELLLKDEIKITIAQSLEDTFLLEEVIKGNHWNLDNVYWYYFK